MLRKCALALALCLVPMMAAAQPGPTAPEANDAKVQALEQRLRGVVADLQAGAPRLDQMEPSLRDAMQQQLSGAVPAIRALGQIKSIAYLGPQNGADAFRIAFENGSTLWIIAIAANGNIAGLAFRPEP